MERRLVYPVREAPDAALVQLERALEEDGFDVDHGSVYDLKARRGADLVLVGLGPHPDGLVARVKAKALVPGRAHGMLDRVEVLLEERLGPPRAPGGRSRA